MCFTRECLKDTADCYTCMSHLCTMVNFTIFVQKCIYKILVITRKLSLCGHILGVLKHANTWDQLLGGDETLKLKF